MDTLLEPLGFAFFQKGLLVAALSGALLGFIGVYIVLRGMSYIGHGLSHAIFGGYAAMQLFAVQFYVLGAGLWGIASAIAITSVARRSRVGADAAIGVVTTASFALGVALFSKFGSSGPSFDNALFGSILGISNTQILWLVVVMIGTGLFVLLRYRELLFTTFDPDVARASGVNVARTEALLMIALSLSILVTLTVIGVTLVAAMLVIPAVIARMLTDSFGRMLALSTVVGLICGITGMYLSYYAGVPSGTMIVLVGAVVFVIVLAVTGARGMHRMAGVNDHAPPKMRMPA
ncbi:MAG: metal ABC transporter permease [Candidatus Nanopelagicales bacterium]|jgi:ABC-type Mn2+/Zn2+ transport system permease subunit|nr:metal ABC transporter permease [Candidatus Nanopelagicales bacterium]MDP4715823.1 metal ABC transporter permease [Candidatus Nanopelagicales bacterium]MDP4907282.1 metal ABC transporter permease [Candidatus Nanopelagicales bacterium]MDP4974875.1 metal ABC transporter permease [Candidatus Nanopelagicales bacterium]MDP5096026.1 metal ABC transporter permease [Candidatus Nanopelagicales bacterium]